MVHTPVLKKAKSEKCKKSAKGPKSSQVQEVESLLSTELLSVLQLQKAQIGSLVGTVTKTLKSYTICLLNVFHWLHPYFFPLLFTFDLT